MALNKFSRSNLRSPVFVFCRYFFQTSNIFRDPLSDAEITDSIKDALDNYSDIELAPFRIKSFWLGKKFNRAFVDQVMYCEDENGNVVDPTTVKEKDRKKIFTSSVAFRTLFKNGFHALEQNSDENTNVKFVTQAFKTGFLQHKEFHEMCLREVRNIPSNVRNEELFITTLLANHLFSRLTARFAGPSYFISINDYSQRFYYCPCKYCDENLEYENFGIGSELLWYGRPDIIVYTLGGGSCCIVRPHEEEDDVDEERCEKDGGNQLIQKKSSNVLRYKNNVQQFLSQAITFSFYQKASQIQKLRNKTSLVTMIPTIAVSGNHFDIYIYDCVNDILLRNKGKPIPLWNKGSESELATLNMSSVLQLWMALNHLSFKPKPSAEEMLKLKGSCDFLAHIPARCKTLIEQTIQMKKRFYPLDEEEEIEVLSLS